MKYLKGIIHGFTQIRAGVMRPEIIIPLEFDEDELKVEETKMSELPIGKVTGLPEKLTLVESETLVRILEAELEDGHKVTLPRANVEVIEE